jgi:hypothetical protein
MKFAILTFFSALSSDITSVHTVMLPRPLPISRTFSVSQQKPCSSYTASSHFSLSLEITTLPSPWMRLPVVWAGWHIRPLVSASVTEHSIFTVHPDCNLCWILLPFEKCKRSLDGHSAYDFRSPALVDDTVDAEWMTWFERLWSAWAG